MNIIRAKHFSLVLVLLILLILVLAGCSDNSKNNGYDDPTESDTLTDEIAVANAMCVPNMGSFLNQMRKVEEALC